MAEIKIQIVGDGSSAIKALNELNKSADRSEKSIGALNKELSKQYSELAKGSGSAEKVVKAERQLLNLIERTTTSFHTSGDAVKNYKKEITYLNNEMQKLYKDNGDNTVVQKLLEQRINAEQTLGDILKQRKEEEAQASREKQEQLDAEYEKQVKINKLVAQAMGNKSEEYRIEIERQTKALREQIEATGQLDAKAKALGSSIQNLTGKMKAAQQTGNGSRIKNLLLSFVSAQAIIWAVRKAVNTLVKTIKEASKAAAEAEETYNLFITTFENVSFSAVNTSKAMSNTFGMANSTAQKALATFGDLAKGYNATDKEALAFAETAAQTTLDIISFKNVTGDMDQIFGNIASGLAGNVENFRKLGYIITSTEVKTNLQKKGLDKLTGSALQFAQIQERLNILVSKSANAQGDMIKTLDSTENVTRRLKEAWKGYLEDFGQGINKWVTPVKKFFAETLEQVNKVKRAKEELANGDGFANIYDLNNPKTRKEFETRIRVNTESIRPSSMMSFNETDSSFYQLSQIMRLFNASADEMSKLVISSVAQHNPSWSDDPTFESDKKAIESFFQSIEDKANLEISSAEALEAFNSAVEGSANKFGSFLDEINGITGIDIPFSDFRSKLLSGSDMDAITSVDGVNSALASSLQIAMGQAFDSLSNTNADEFLDPIKKAFGEIDGLDGYETKLESIKKLYEAIYNVSLEDGELTEDESNRLAKLVKLYGEVKKESEAITAEKERQQKIDNAISTLGSSSEDYSKQIAQVGMDERAVALDDLKREYEPLLNSMDSASAKYKELQSILLKTEEALMAFYDAVEANEELEAQKAKEEERRQNLASAISGAKSSRVEYFDKVNTIGADDRTLAMNDLMRSRSEAWSLASTNEEIQAVTDEFKLLAEALNRYYDALDRNTKLEEAKEKQKAFNDAVQSYSDKTENFFKDDKILAFEELEKTFIEFANSTIKLGEGTENLNEAYGEMVASFEEYYSLLEQQTMINKTLGQTGAWVNAAISASTGNFTDLINCFVELISETDAFQTLMSIVNESILPVLNAFLEVANPMLQALASLLKTIIYGILVPFFPVLKAIMYSLTLSIGMLNIGLGFVIDIFKKVAGYVVYWVTSMWNSVVRVLRSINIFGWQPFSGLNEYDNSWAKAWADTDILGNDEKRKAELAQQLSDIRNATMDIKENTADKTVDISAYQEMLKANVITLSEYSALVNAKVGNHAYDAVQSYGNGTYHVGAGGASYISYGSVNIQINGDNLNSKQIAEEVIKSLENRNRPGRQSIA